MVGNELKLATKLLVERLSRMASEYLREVEHNLDTEKKRSNNLENHLNDTSLQLSKSRDTCVTLTKELAKSEGTKFFSMC